MRAGLLTCGLGPDLFLVSIPYVYGRVFHFSLGESGVVYVTQFIGSCIGMGKSCSLVVGRFAFAFAYVLRPIAAYDQYCGRFYRRNVAKRGPEARLYTACALCGSLPRSRSRSEADAYPFFRQSEAGYAFPSALSSFVSRHTRMYTGLGLASVL